VSNADAQAMYSKFGFEITGVRKGYYVETNEDAYVMVANSALSNAYRLRLENIRDQLTEPPSHG
jgi:hypothetical protein